MCAETENSRTVSLSGELTIRTIAEAQQTLQSALSEIEALAIDLSAADETDLTLIQLLYAARLSATEEGKTLSLCGTLPETLAANLERGGFLDSTDTFWTLNG